MRGHQGRFQVDHPVLSKQRPQPGSKDLGVRKKLQVSLEVELAILKSLLERSDELATKDFPQHFLREESSCLGTNPAGVIQGEAAGRNDTMDMGMNIQFLAPGVQHTEETDLCTQMSGIASHLEKGFRTGTEQEAVEDFLVLQQQWG